MTDDRVVCNCMGVTKSEIIEAIVQNDLFMLEEVREQTGAGTGCHSCIGELEAILKEATD